MHANQILLKNNLGLQSHLLRGTYFSQYHASSAPLRWPGDGDCYLMHKRQSGDWHYLWQLTFFTQTVSGNHTIVHTSAELLTPDIGGHFVMVRTSAELLTPDIGGHFVIVRTSAELLTADIGGHFVSQLDLIKVCMWQRSTNFIVSYGVVNNGSRQLCW